MADGDQIYEKQLSTAYWFVTHKLLLKNILIVILIVLNIGLISFDLYLVINNLVLGNKDYQALLTSLTNPNPDYVALRQFRLPMDLQSGNIKTLVNTKGFDILADLENPNSKWAATFDYQFQIGEALTPIKSGFIFPSEKKTIFNLAIDNGNLASQVILSNINWTKEIDFPALKDQKFKFDIGNVKFIPSAELGVGEKISVNRVTFDVTNQSAYNFANVNFILFLNSSSQIVAVNQISSGNFSSGKTLNLESTFFQKLPRIDSVQVVPDVNILNPDVFLKY
jgi:hypothetical protein